MRPLGEEAVFSRGRSKEQEVREARRKPVSGWFRGCRELERTCCVEVGPTLQS